MAVRHDADPKALIAARKREAMKPGRGLSEGRGSGLTPRIRKAVEFLVFGRPDDRGTNVTVDEAAAEVGLRPRAVREALLKPAVVQYHQQMVTALRNGEKAASFRAIADIRDDAKLKDTAAGQKVRLDAARTLAYEPVGNQIQVNTQVNVNGRTVTPGYVIDLESGRRRRLEQLEKVVEDNGLFVPLEDVGPVIDGEEA